MSEKHKKRKAKARKASIKSKLLKKRLFNRKLKKLEQELFNLKKEVEPKLEPIRKNKDDNQS
jgi:hypothetical protein